MGTGIRGQGGPQRAVPAVRCSEAAPLLYATTGRRRFIDDIYDWSTPTPVTDARHTLRLRNEMKPQ